MRGLHLGATDEPENYMRHGPRRTAYQTCGKRYEAGGEGSYDVHEMKISRLAYDGWYSLNDVTGWMGWNGTTQGPDCIAGLE